jgi:hypothetical protein
MTMTLALWFGLVALAEEEPPCDPYWERRHGEHAEGTLYTTYCSTPAGSQGRFSVVVGARWEGPSGETVRSELLRVDNVTFEEVSLEEGVLTLQASAMEGLVAPAWTRYRATFDPVGHKFGPASLLTEQDWAQRLQQEADERIAAGDRVVVGGLLGRTSPGEKATYDGLIPYVSATRDAARDEARAGRSRAAADRVLSLFAGRTSPQPAPRGAQLVVPLVGSLWLDLSQGEQFELAHDLATLLDEGGEYTAAASLLATLAAHGGGEVGVPLPAPPEVANDAEERFVEALAQGDLERAKGAAASGRFAAEQRPEWWRAGAAELLRRQEQGDLSAIGPIFRYLGRMPDGMRAQLQDELRPAVLALSSVEPHVWAWQGQPDDPEELVALSRTSDHGAERVLLEKALEMTGAEAAVALGVVEGDLCALVVGGPRRQRVICGRPETKADTRTLDRPPPATEPRCSASEWPCFTPTAQGASSAGIYRCGVDLLGQPWCTGDTPVTELVPLNEGGYRRVVAGMAHACALHEDQHVSCWGDTRKGRAPRRVDGVADVAAAEGWTCLLDLQGEVTCKGKKPPRVPELPPRPEVLSEEDYARLIR